MIITELSYQEVASEASDLEGGVDLSLNATQFEQATSIMNSGSTSGPLGSTSYANAQSVKIKSSSFAALVLGA